MKPTTPALAAHLAGEVTTLATCWRLERADGWVRGFTDHLQVISRAYNLQNVQSIPLVEIRA